MSSLNIVAEAFAVIGEIIANLVSSSQIDRFLDCERKWAWRYIAKVREEQGPAAALGTECDDTQLQPYLRDGRPIDYSRRSGYVVQPGLGFLPQPRSPGIELQRHFILPSPTVSMLAFQGYIDLWVPDSRVMPDAAYDPKQGVRRDIPAVVDFKTTGNWDYQKHAKQLATDTQAQLYAKWAMAHTWGHEIDLVWVYFGTKGAYKAKRSHLRVHRDHVDEQFTRINAVAEKIHTHRKLQTHPLQLAPNPAACGKYGGCPYESKCNLSPGQKTDAAAAQHARQKGYEMSSTAELLARLKQQNPVTSAPPTVEEHVAANPRAAFLLEQPRTAAGIPIANIPTQYQPTVTAAPPTPLGVNPPEKSLPPAPAVGTVAAPPPAPAAEVKKGPGRPRKNQAKDPVGADAVLHTETPSAPEPVETPPLAGTAVSVTWAEEVFSPIPYNTFKVGPFEATGTVRAGETIAQAQARLYAELVTFAENARAEKAVSFQKTLAAMGGAR